MPLTLEQFGLDRLTTEERLELIGQLWDSLSISHRPVPRLKEWQRKLLEERMAAADADPDGGIPWDVFRAELLAKK
jgi:putative addiction module component (TIGR02574 family)